MMLPWIGVREAEEKPFTALNYMTPPAVGQTPPTSTQSPTRSILFVSADRDEARLVQEGLADMRPRWQMESLEDPVKALARVQAGAVDAAVIDLLLPGTSGVDLLRSIMEGSPTTLRIGLTSGSERHAIQQVGAPVHQLLSKPCDPMVLKAVLARAFASQDFVSHDAFQRLLASITSLPVLPQIYNELMKELRSEDCSLERAGLIVARDMGLSAKILQLVNSAFFGLGRTIGHPSEAAMFIGSENLRALVLSLQVFSQFQQLKLAEFSVENLWKHSWTTGVLAKKLCEFEETNRTVADESFISGLLHDLGKLVLAANFAPRLEENIRLARERQHTLWEQEFKIWGASHAELGGHLLSKWGLASGVVEAVAFHHRPAQARCQTFCAVTAVHVANTLGRPPAGTGQVPQQSVDQEYLRGLGLADRIDGWKQMLREASERRS